MLIMMLFFQKWLNSVQTLNGSISFYEFTVSLRTVRTVHARSSVGDPGARKGGNACSACVGASLQDTDYGFKICAANNASSFIIVCFP